ncbi:MAG TPA: tripartite tricarboxylate transporter substrate binding protein [Pseudolabrys sp.]|nr:tripartite tricarboxylate transporter substrate binding protein [Pseudolabrys sp.]
MKIFAALAAGALALVCATAPQARAEDYPSRTIRLIVGAPPGGTTDTIARSIAVPMAAALKQSVVVENKAGAGGNIAAEYVAKSPADGYTLLVSFSSHTINASLYPHLPYDPAADFTAITKVATVPSMLVGNPKLPAKDVKALIALAKEKPGKLTIGIGGIGSSLHLAGEKFKLATGAQLLNVPYKGTAPALTDLLGGNIDLMFISLVTGTQQVRAGNLHAFGVTSPQRQPSLPDVPAIAESVPGFESSAWFGVFGPAKLPPEVTKKLNQAIVAGLAAPEMQNRLKTEGATPVGDSPEDFAAFVREDIKRWAPIVKASGAKPN